MWRVGLMGSLLVLSFASARAGEPRVLEVAEGYRGIWYSNQKLDSEYVYKYSGGMATYPWQHTPIAIYAPAVEKTFFVYGGSEPDKRTLLHMVSYFDHASGTVPRPRVLMHKETSDAHDNPTLLIDRQGYLWVFSNAHGTSRPAYISRSAKPYSIDAFEQVQETNFSYSQPWYLDDGTFLFLHTRYVKGQRRLHWMTSGDGRSWSEPQVLAQVAEGHYQVSYSDGRRLVTAFNYHPKPGGLNARTNLYFAMTDDGGRSWTTAGGAKLETPLTEVNNAALVHDYQAEKLLCYMKDVQLDDQGRPAILFMTSRGFAPGPQNDPRTWRLATWSGSAWTIRELFTSDHNYDHGSLYIEDDGTWRIIAPTEPGPQPYGAGGDMVLWTSGDRGESWQRLKQLTRSDDFNHTFARRPIHARDDFYALWADGHSRKPSSSRLYFTNRTGEHVWQLPETMDGETARPALRW